MKFLMVISILFFCFSCSDKGFRLKKETDNLNHKTETLAVSKIKTDTAKSNPQNEVMKEEDILFNGKLKMFFTLEEFEDVFGKADSTKLLTEEQPCVSTFENEDGSIDIEDKYLYKDGSRFENSKKKVAVDEFRFTENNFILYKGIKLNSSTTINDLKKIFPNAVKDIGIMDVDGEGKLEVIQLREDEEGISDGHIKIFIKNGKLYFIHWWFPC